MAKSELVYGIHAVRHLLERAPERVLEAWLQASAHGETLLEIDARLQQQGIAIQRTSPATLDKLSGNAVHQGIVLRCRTAAEEVPDLNELIASAQMPLFLVLDGVQDPHNLGACLRTAAAAGAAAVIIPRDRAVGMNETVRKVASGAADILPLLRVTNLARTLKQLRQAGVWLAGCTADAPASLYETDLNRPLALILGAEGSGLRRLTREQCDYLVTIPMSGAIESLNVSVATGICLFEALRQRHLKSEV